MAKRFFPITLEELAKAVSVNVKKVKEKRKRRGHSQKKTKKRPRSGRAVVEELPLDLQNSRDEPIL